MKYRLAFAEQDFFRRLLPTSICNNSANLKTDTSCIIGPVATIELIF